MSRASNKADIPLYLANVLHVAGLDRRRGARESAVWDTVVERLGATDEDVAAAGRLLQGSGNNIFLPRSTHARMENLQDMLMMALADGRITPQEAGPIERVARTMRYTQADVDLALKRAESELRKIQRAADRKRRAAEAAASQRSQETPVSASAPSQAAVPPPLPPKRSVAGGAPVEDASEDAAGQLPVDSEPYADTTDAATVEPPQPADEDAAVPAADLPAEPVPPVEQAVNLPDRVRLCAAACAAAEDRRGYCFGLPDGELNPWGCRLSGLDWSDGADWFKAGRFRDASTFEFDKREIAERLSGNLSVVTGCPYFSEKFAEYAFEALPRRVTIGERWAYRTPDSADDAEIIETVEYIYGCPLRKTVFSDGVTPRGGYDAYKIIRKAAKRVGLSSALLRRIRKMLPK